MTDDMSSSLDAPVLVVSGWFFIGVVPFQVLICVQSIGQIPDICIVICASPFKFFVLIPKS